MNIGSFEPHVGCSVYTKLRDSTFTAFALAWQVTMSISTGRRASKNSMFDSKIWPRRKHTVSASRLRHPRTWPIGIWTVQSSIKRPQPWILASSNYSLHCPTWTKNNSCCFGEDNGHLLSVLVADIDIREVFPIIPWPSPVMFSVLAWSRAFAFALLLSALTPSNAQEESLCQSLLSLCLSKANTI